MWPRITELCLGTWLVLSPWIVSRVPGDAYLHASAAACGALVVVLSVFSLWSRRDWARFAVGAAALWLGGFAWASAPRPGPPAAQNAITVGLLLATLFLLPNRASLPPRPWRRQDRLEPRDT
jgi:hypothetical protein